MVEALGKNLGNHEYAQVCGEPTFGSEPGFYPSPERSYVLGLGLTYRR